MSEIKKLSHSKVSKYLMCPKSYKYHYVDKLKPLTHSGALYFGSAIDKALNELLLPTEGKLPEDILLEEFSKDGRKTDINVVYANSDFDEDLLERSDITEAKELLASMGVSQISDKMLVVEFKKLKKQKMDQGFDSFNDNQKKFYNFMNWLSMYRKGLLMLRDYRTEVLPLLEKVLMVQIEINHKINDNLVVNGFVDFIAKTKDGKIVLFDNKTSGITYDSDAVTNSPQLALYKEAIKTLYPDLQIDHAGFIVIRKNIAKNTIKTCGICGNIATGRHKTCDALNIKGTRCGGDWIESIKPETQFQILVDKIPQTYKDIVVANYKEVEEGITKEVFPRNFDKCKNYYGGLCTYYAWCHRNDKKGLINEKEATN